jgi:signal transduction histidine kinase
VDLTQLAQEAIETLHGRLHANGITVRIAGNLPNVYGDRLRLREVFENLIDNAAKYMGDHPHPTIEIGMRSQDGNSVFYIKDNGIGIESIYHKRVFALFEKLDPTMEGTGIGLALVKRIIETHGGRIWVESDGVGMGSAFCFTVPEKIQA